MSMFWTVHAKQDGKWRQITLTKFKDQDAAQRLADFIARRFSCKTILVRGFEGIQPITDEMVAAVFAD